MRADGVLQIDPQEGDDRVVLDNWINEFGQDRPTRGRKMHVSMFESVRARSDTRENTEGGYVGEEGELAELDFH